MTKFITIFLVLFFLTTKVKALDLNVNEGGVGGAYTSITAAITAANDGDRIIIEPRSGGATYFESLSITKSIQLLSSVEAAKYRIQGNITITTTTPKEIAIIGADVVGSISTANPGFSSSRTIVKVLYCTVEGNVDFDQDNYDVSIVNCTIDNGYAAIRYGKIIGNSITNSSLNHVVFIKDEGTNLAPVTSDTIHIIGNRITSNASNGYTCIIASTNNYFYNISNNFLKYGGRGISITDWNSNIIGTNEINNNTLDRNSVNTTSYGIYLSSITPGGVVNVYNNLLEGQTNGTARAISITSSMQNGFTNIQYNHIKSSSYDNYFSGFTNDGTNTTIGGITIDATTGAETSGVVVNLGHPNPVYSDHDLTRNDVGCFGGSFSMSNYFITGDTNNNRVYHINMPRSVYTGTPISIESESFDK